MYVVEVDAQGIKVLLIIRKNGETSVAAPSIDKPRLAKPVTMEFRK
jgi:hypothetical protein